MKELYASLVKAQKAFAPALKTSTNPHYKSRYADLAVVVEAVVDALNDNGIFVTQRTKVDERGVVVSTCFLHESGQFMDCGELFVPAAKHDPQGFGSALTYARRYSLMAATGIAPEDDDGIAAVDAQKKAGAKPPAQKEQSKPQSKSTDDKFIVKFGKFRGQDMRNMNPDDLDDYCAFLVSKARDEGKQISEPIQAFLDTAREVLGIPPIPPIPPQDEVSF